MRLTNFCNRLPKRAPNLNCPIPARTALGDSDYSGSFSHTYQNSCTNYAGCHHHSSPRNPYSDACARAEFRF